MARPGVLTYGHRQVLETNWGGGKSISEIAAVLGTRVSTVSREIRRNNSGHHGVKNPLLRQLPMGPRRAPYRVGYRAEWAQRRADKARLRPKPAKLVTNRSLRAEVVAGLKQRWSPRQIAGWLTLHHPDQPETHVSHETIYQAIYLQSRGNLRAELHRQVALRSGRTRRRRQSRAARAARASRRPWVGDLNISQRPAEATDRAVPGHWEGDLLIGTAGQSAIITLVERSTRYVMLGTLPDGRASTAVITTLSTLAERIPEHLRRSLAWDQGNEMAEHATFTTATHCPVYFCDPHSPWQRGSNENTNGLLRQYFPKGRFDFTTVNQTDLDRVAHELNNRPRRTHDWHTPAEQLNELLSPA